jgi:hypothetical protein
MMGESEPSITRINPPELGTPPGYSQIVDVRAGRDHRLVLGRLRGLSEMMVLAIMIAFAPRAFAGQAIDAKRAITIGRHACSARETALAKRYGRVARVRPQDWRAEKLPEGWSVMATANGVFLTVAISRSGHAAECQAETID